MTDALVASGTPRSTSAPSPPRRHPTRAAETDGPGPRGRAPRGRRRPRRRSGEHAPVVALLDQGAARLGQPLGQFVVDEHADRLARSEVRRRLAEEQVVAVDRADAGGAEWVETTGVPAPWPPGSSGVPLSPPAAGPRGAARVQASEHVVDRARARPRRPPPGPDRAVGVMADQPDRDGGDGLSTRQHVGDQLDRWPRWGGSRTGPRRAAHGCSRVGRRRRRRCRPRWHDLDAR